MIRLARSPSGGWPASAFLDLVALETWGPTPEDADERLMRAVRLNACSRLAAREELPEALPIR